MAELAKYEAEVELFKKASQAARDACNKKLADNPGVWYPCGFAWVVIRPARGKFVKMLKDHDEPIGHPAYGGGYMIWNPAQSATQWKDALLAGANAFAQVLTEAGLSCTSESRDD